MITKVKCKCNKLTGTARVVCNTTTLASGGTIATLAWNLNGEFTIKKGTNLPTCTACMRPAMGSDWKSEKAVR